MTCTASVVTRMAVSPAMSLAQLVQYARSDASASTRAAAAYVSCRAASVWLAMSASMNWIPWNSITRWSNCLRSAA